MILTIYDSPARIAPLMHFHAEDDGSVRIFLREPMNTLHFLPSEIKAIKAFLETM